MILGLTYVTLLVALGDPSDAAAGVRREREGALLRSQSGAFEVEGDRLTFVATDPPRRFVALENRCLERVERLLSDKGPSLRFTVDGTITEFRGANYLLLTRATVEPSPAPSSPFAPSRTAQR